MASPTKPVATKGVRTPNRSPTTPANTGPIMNAIPAIVIGRASADSRRSRGASSPIQAMPAVQTVPNPSPNTKRAASSGQKPGIACASSAPDIRAAETSVSRRAP